MSSVDGDSESKSSSVQGQAANSSLKLHLHEESSSDDDPLAYATKRTSKNKSNKLLVESPEKQETDATEDQLNESENEAPDETSGTKEISGKKGTVVENPDSSESEVGVSENDKNKPLVCIKKGSRKEGKELQARSPEKRGEDSPGSKMSESGNDASDEENRKIETNLIVKSATDKVNQKRKRSTEPDSSTSEGSLESEDENKNPKKRRKDNNQSGKASKEESSKIVRLKRYLSIAGIRIRNYSKTFEGCTSKKSKEMKLIELLEDEGLKGKPTIEKCKKLRKKIERKKEVAELDLGNIISTGDGNKHIGRTRITRNRLHCREKTEEKNLVKNNSTSMFGNLSGIVDSEGSDHDQIQSKKQKSKKLYILDSD